MEKEKLEQIEFQVRKWIEKEGHDKCHYYPEIFQEIAKILKLEVTNIGLPPRCEFEEGCKKYQEEIYDS